MKEFSEKLRGTWLGQPIGLGYVEKIENEIKVNKDLANIIYNFTSLRHTQKQKMKKNLCIKELSFI